MDWMGIYKKNKYLESHRVYVAVKIITNMGIYKKSALSESLQFARMESETTKILYIPTAAP